MFDLKGKKIIITGASSGLGQVTAIQLSQLGAGVCLVGRNEKRLNETLSKMKSNEKHCILPTDLTHFDGYDALFKKIVENMGPLDGLVHFAGILKTLPLKVMKTEILREILDINLIAFLELTKYFTKKGNVNEKGASIVGISSVLSFKGAPAMSGYGSSKAALDGAVRSLACEFAAKKIRVNSIAAGFVPTPLRGTAETLSQEAIAKIKNDHPLGVGAPEDIAYLAVYLLSDESKWMTGSTVTIDGGFSIAS
jgi:NAD(P)-dependent dehydrogenase (short-subunit alcohol dehydrogenase family)